MKPCITLSANTAWYLYNFRATTIKALQNQGYEVICIAPDDGYGKRIPQDLGAKWLPLMMDNQGSNPVKDSAVFLQLWWFYRKFKPKAVLHFTIKNNVYGTWAAHRLGIPALNNVSGLGTAFIHKGLISKVVRGLYKSSFPYTHTVFCQNPEDKQFLTDNGLVPASKLTLLPGSGADIDKFHPDKRIEDDSRPFTFLYAGRMLADKGLRELIAAMDILQAQGAACRLVMCGFSNVKNFTAISERELKEWNLRRNVSYIGPTDDMPAELAKIDAAVLPSYREGMPKSLLEAGAMGLSAVATDVPGCRNVIKDGFNGLLCEVKSAESLAEKMQTLIDMPLLQREQMERNARAHIVEHFSERRVVELTLHALSKALGETLSLPDEPLMSTNNDI